MNDYDDFTKKGAFDVKIKPVLTNTFRLYRENFVPLCLALLVQLVLRAICLTPLMFQLDKALAPLSWLCVPLYILIALPARQNYALALQDMMNGGSVFTTRLISTEHYGRKLLRGVCGLLKLLAWSALTITGVTVLYMYYTGFGGVDAFTYLNLFSKVGGGSITAGIFTTGAAVAATGLLIVLGCAVHSGVRHARAMGDMRLLRGNRLRLTALWFAGLVLVVPFLLGLLGIMGDWALNVIAAFKKTGQLSAVAISARQIWMLSIAALALLCPVLPLKNLLPAVALRQVKEAKDAQA